MKSGICPDMPFMVNDWLSSVQIAGMTPAQEGAYIHLLCYAWNNEDCTLPDNSEQLAVLSRLGVDWEKFGPAVRACFQADPDNPGRIFNPKQRQVRTEQMKRIKTARDKARTAANKRWGKSDAQALPKQCSSDAQALHEDMLENASSPVSRPSTPIVPNSKYSTTGLPTKTDGGQGKDGTVQGGGIGKDIIAALANGLAASKSCSGPTLGAVLGYGKFKGYPLEDCKRFHELNSRNGWKFPNNDKPIGDWESALHNFVHKKPKGSASAISRKPTVPERAVTPDLAPETFPATQVPAGVESGSAEQPFEEQLADLKQQEQALTDRILELAKQTYKDPVSGRYRIKPEAMAEIDRLKPQREAIRKKIAQYGNSETAGQTPSARNGEGSHDE